MNSENKSHGGRMYDDVFQFPNRTLSSFTFSFVAYVLVIGVAPNIIPDCLWPLAQFGKYMATHQSRFITGCCYLVAISHTLEAAYAAKVCHGRRYSLSTAMKWISSVFIFGFPSTLRLLSMVPRSKQT